MIHLIHNNTIEQSWSRLPLKAVRSDGLVIHADHEYRSYGKEHLEAKGIFWDEREQVSIGELQSVNYASEPTIINGRPVLRATVTDKPLADAKRIRIEQVKQEGLRRIQAVLPGVRDFDTLQLIAELWGSLVSQAKSPTPTFQTAIDTYNAGVQAINAVNAFATFQQVADADPVNDPNWPT